MAVPQTHKIHCIKAKGADEVRVADISSEIEECFRVCRICWTVTPPIDSITSPGTDNAAQPQLPALKLTVGQWVVAKYKGQEFPGEVKLRRGSKRYAQKCKCLEVAKIGRQDHLFERQNCAGH